MEPEDPTGHILSYLHRHMRTQFDTGVQCVKKYIERNAFPELEKAFAFQVFSTAMTQWGQSVLEAAHTAADVTGFNHEVIRRSASSFFFCVAALNQPSDEIEEEVITIELASQRGRCIDPTSLVNSEDFKIKAREFVRQNAYKKGEPNMTECLQNVGRDSLQCQNCERDGSIVVTSSWVQPKASPEGCIF